MTTQPNASPTSLAKKSAELGSGLTPKKGLEKAHPLFRVSVGKQRLHIGQQSLSWEQRKRRDIEKEVKVKVKGIRMTKHVIAPFEHF